MIDGNVSLEIEHEIFRGDRRTDVINIVEGIANALEGIIYGDDNQVKEIHFKQISSQRDRYKIRIRKL